MRLFSRKKADGESPHVAAPGGGGASAQTGHSSHAGSASAQSNDLHARKLLQQYFHSLARLHFGGVSALLKDKRNQSLEAPWPSLIAALNALASCESHYYSLSFLSFSEAKWLKKESLGTLYVQVFNTLQQLLSHTSLHHSGSSTSSSSPYSSSSIASVFVNSQLSTQASDALTSNQDALSSGATSSSASSDATHNASVESLLSSSSPEASSTFLSVILRDCCDLIQCRLKMINVYVALASATSTPPPYDVLVSTVSAVVERFSGTTQVLLHPWLSLIRENTILETTVLEKLLQAQIALSKYQFKDCVFLTFHTKTLLDTWMRALSLDKGQAIVELASPSKQKTSCDIYVWLREFNLYTTAKMVLYFFNIYKKQKLGNGKPVDMRSFTSNCRPDFYSMIEGFAQKTEATSVCLMYEVPRVQEKGAEFSLSGYVLPQGAEAAHQAPTGLSSWPAIFSYPAEPRLEHWPNLIAITLDNKSQLEQYKPPLYYYDKTVDCTYFISRVDTAITLVAIFTKKQRSNDPNIRTSLNNIAYFLRNGWIFSQLKTK
ncbi:hypothetical protein QOT17_013504 [Balamuthia mandrillaris]